MTIYLKFTTQEQAESELTNAGYQLSEYKDHITGNGWGTVFTIPDYSLPTVSIVNGMEFTTYPLIPGVHCNIYDCDTLPESLSAFVIPAPKNPYNVVAL